MYREDYINAETTMYYRKLEAGTYNPIVSLGGIDAVNYSLVSANANFVINKADLQIIWTNKPQTGYTYVYNGEPKYPEPQINGVKGNDTPYELLYKVNTGGNVWDNYSTTPISAGKYSVTVNLLTQSVGKNYNISGEGVQEFTITSANLSGYNVVPLKMGNAEQHDETILLVVVYGLDSEFAQAPTGTVTIDYKNGTSSNASHSKDVTLSSSKAYGNYSDYQAVIDTYLVNKFAFGFISYPEYSDGGYIPKFAFKCGDNSTYSKNYLDINSIDIAVFPSGQ